MSLRLKLIASCLLVLLAALAPALYAHLAIEGLRREHNRSNEQYVVPLQTLDAVRSMLASVADDYEASTLGKTSAEKATASPLLAARLPAIIEKLSDAGLWLSGSAELAPSGKRVVEIAGTLSALTFQNTSLSIRKTAAVLDRAEGALGESLADIRSLAASSRNRIDETSASDARVILSLAGGALLFGLIVTALLSRHISGRLRGAVATARRVASGDSDVEIAVSGGDEVSVLMRLLGEMQSDIRHQVQSIESLRRDQATSYIQTIRIQNARFNAALNNMSQALCLFDADNALVIYNDRFEQMFGKREIGMTADLVRQDPYLRPTLSATGAAAIVETMPDGRILALSRRGVMGGGFVVTMEDITTKHREDETMRHLARHDGLTDLPNRIHFRERLITTLVQSGATVLGLDLDGFKAVNDTLGHPLGDKLLQEVAKRLQATGHGDLFVARIGGDEFAIVVTGCLGAGEASRIAEGIIRDIARPFSIDGHEIQIGVSIGIVCCQRSPSNALVDEVVKQVDLALYSSKGEGKNVYRFFEKEMSDRLQRRRDMEIDLRSAVERQKEIELFYQPFVKAETGAISGFEALIRWRHPTQGMISPGEFIPLAEDTGLIQQLGLWVLKSACAEAMTWPDHLGLSVNLSPVQFRNKTLYEDARRIILDSGLSPRRLQLEVTESLMLENPEQIFATLQAFRDMGIRISMDDFGTGYSSLAYLTKYPFDKVKIDQSFVRNIHIPQNLAVVRSVISLSTALGMAVIAEGIETSEQLAILMEERCPEMQGYFFSRPVPVSDIPALLLKNLREAMAVRRPEPVALAV
ncbi:hypothetical protein ASG43_04860 [Aureimonas sp. Leaf454]|uniref:putative bifunctional diguanylate cyclase/phosphodiesterase n=1 Tax=Aureimonas sp. Leaf454 TaxID=1736381 RepID=UPI0006F5AFD1|nr:EAL domain-containing protein [Aureimonas sp. Leaf454]KQT54875.1 hypothetical protein ASG43_04860 [Aureimonas sp. Leaf454]